MTLLRRGKRRKTGKREERKNSVEGRERDKERGRERQGQWISGEQWSG